MAAVFPGGNGATTFVPNFEASGKIVIGYSRNPKDFPLNQYITLVPVKQGIGYYLKLTNENAGRILSSTVAEHVWPDGNDAPSGKENIESSEFFKFLTERYAYAFRLGYKSVDQADWNILAYHAEMAAQQAMTGRTVLVNAKLETTGNWTNTGTFTALAGNFADQGTASSPVFKKGLQKAGIVINKATFGRVKPKSLICRVSPDLADPIGRSQEIHAYLKESPYALAQVRGDVENQNGLWGLPSEIYGFKIVVEDAVYDPYVKGYPASPQTLSYVADSNKMAIVARPGELEGVQGAPSFSTVHLWVYEDMTVWSKQDDENRNHKGRIVDDVGIDIVSDISGYLFTNMLS